MRLRELALFMEAISTGVLVLGSYIYCDLFSREQWETARIMTQKKPMVDLWCSLKFKKDYGKGSAGTSLWVLWLTAGWGKDVLLTVLKTVGGSDLRFFLYVPLESPCSPMIQPCTLFGGMFSFSPIKKWNRAVSRLVPLPITRSAGRPLIFHATYVKTSTET